MQSELWNNFKECYSIKLGSSPFQVSREATTNMDATSVTCVWIHHVLLYQAQGWSSDGFAWDPSSRKEDLLGAALGEHI